jgi:endonuclease YncB( thermonuclease family)
MAVQDGDTLYLRNAGHDQVRIIGVDAPELDATTQEYATKDQDVWCVTENDGRQMAKEAKAFVEEWLGRPTSTNPITVELEIPGGPDVDKYNRLLAYVFYRGQSLTGELVRRGLGNAFMRDYNGGASFPNIDASHAREFEALEVEAKAQQAGFWGAYGPRDVPSWFGLTRSWPSRCTAPPADLTGRWNGLWGSDNLREVLVLTQESAAFNGTSYFENRQGATMLSGHGVVSGSISAPRVQFTLSRDGLAFSWSGTVDTRYRTLTGTFAGYSNDATYTKE